MALEWRCMLGISQSFALGYAISVAYQSMRLSFLVLPSEIEWHRTRACQGEPAHLSAFNVGKTISDSRVQCSLAPPIHVCTELDLTFARILCSRTQTSNCTHPLDTIFYPPAITKHSEHSQKLDDHALRCGIPDMFHWSESGLQP
ncbi:hypothetical protein BDW59DRAFT_46758 [Aspergillus cavernicola]|uniref:Major facilitator superfamily (MFS) profile domain-containing protein n=1 Tax=Aspergillus cavernicola TaxID=176166 RepID=A0ABR4J2Z2_9EURO